MTAFVTDTTILAAQEALTAAVMSLPGVVGTAQGLCEGLPCLQVLVSTTDSELLEQLPKQLHGFIVDVKMTGEIRAQDTTGATGG